MIICYGKKLVGKVGSSLKAGQGILFCTSNKQPVTSGIDLPGFFKRLIAKTHILYLLMTVALWLACTGVSYGDIIINAPMTDTNSTGWYLGGTPTSSLLTGNGTIDPVGSGWLRLTSNSGNQTGFAYNTTTFDLSQGLLIQFDYSTWGGSGADGYSVYLFDAGVSPFNIGAFGGSLGYAQKLSTATCSPVTPSVAGISGGYVGIGVDEYGNFAYGCEGRYNGASLRANTVTIRGSVVGFGGGAIGSTLAATSYPWIATSANNGSLWYNGVTRPDQTSTNYRRVTIRISPAPNPVANVWIQFGYNTTPVQMITNAALPAISTSQSLMMGYAASTGSLTNYHEIRNLLVTNAATSTTINLGLAKSVLDTTTSSTTTTAVGDGIRYTVTARNYGPNNVTASGVGIVDNIPTSITNVTWACAVVAGSPSGTSCGTASGSGNTLNTTANLPYGGAVTYTINGTVSAPTTSVISNTASLVIPGGITDYNSADDSAAASIAVANLATSTKTVTDLNGGNYTAGDTLQYTITLNDNGGFATSGVSVSDTINTNLTWSSIASCPSGATCSYSGGVLTVTGISIPANGSVTIVYNATISGSAAVGTTISNTATINNPNGTVVTAVAPVVTVAGTVALTGTKLLYLYDGTSSPTWKLSRTPNTTSTNYATLAINGGSRTWAMNPVAASNIIINSTVNANVPVTLYLTRSATTGNRSVEVDLQCSSGGTILTQTRTLTLSTTVTAYAFSLPITTSPLTCGQGNYWNLTVKNNSTTAGYTINVYPQSGGTPSHVDLPATTVINVNSIGFYNGSYAGGGAAITSVNAGTTVYIRAVVSDPFGSYIISVPTITISNPSGTAITPSPTMALVATGTETPSLTKTYECSYLVPSSPAGNWTIKVTATEGTEGTVTDTGYATMPVVIPPVLTVVKSTDKTSVSSGGIITYTILVTNTSSGTATSAIVTDPVPVYTTYVANSTRLNGITVAGDGSTSPLIGGLLVDNNSGRTAGVAATGVLPAGASATVTFQVTAR